MYAATLISPFECQRFALDQTHHQRQQAVNDQVNNPCRTEHHYIVGASVQQLAVSHHFHQRNGVCQRGTFTNHAFDSLIPSLKFRKYDAVISGMDITPERSKQVSFTTPYYENSAVVIAKKDTYKTFADLKGKRIGMENGTTHQKYIQDQHPEVKTVSYDSYQNAFIDLKNGRIDGVFGDTAVVNEWLKTNPQLGVATEKVTDPQYFGTGLGIAVRPDNKALLEKLNNALAAIKADGTYQKISDQWFPQ